ncbi:MAG TPA: DUF853 family protein [Fimbriimonadaceae bacterium]|nr:DUF853 family protein [Fimbriimonadaceae bacterium]
MANPIFIGRSDAPVLMDPKFGNRHGLITGATGTGKTVTLQILAEAFSAMGTPVFMADVKGDVSGMCMPGGGNPKLESRAKEIGLDPYTYAAMPVVFWDLFGEKGHRLRATISEMGPLLLSRLLQLNETQEGVLNIAFKVADEQGLLLLDLKDLRAMLASIAENAKEIQREYGLVSETSVGAIQRALLVLEQQGAEHFFGEPALDLNDFIRTTSDGRGVVNLLSADKLMNNPRLYSSFLLWLLSELFEQLPEVGDLERPKLVFFFDEAHLLFNEAPKALIEKVEQVVRLIRSKGVGVYFCSQNPLDVPDSVLAQLGNRVQHALRAYTPREEKAVNTAADTFRPNPAFKTAEVITQLGVGEALVSVLEEKGVPSIVQRTFIRPPSSRLGPCTPEERRAVMGTSPVGGKYDQEIDRESAYEILKQKATQAQAEEDQELGKVQLPPAGPKIEYKEPAPRPEPRRRSDSPFEATLKSVLRSAGSTITRELTRGILGGLFKRRR